MRQKEEKACPLKSKESQPTFLVVYYHRFSYPMRRTIEDHIFALERHIPGRYLYLNVAFGIPSWIFAHHYDWVLFQTTFFAQLKWKQGSYEALMGRWRRLKQLKGRKAIIPQDEFLRSDLICRFIEDFQVEALFSCASEEEIPRLYDGVDLSSVHTEQVLTGYLSEETVKEIGEQAQVERPIDIGYRAWKAEYWLGRHGMLKGEVAHRFQEASEGLITDISMDEKAMFLGVDWYRFLWRCKYTIGCEGGSSIKDHTGSIRRRVHAYLAASPQGSFEEVEKHCFEGRDGELNLKALSPRHLEACATQTCQILVEGEYNGVLEPWRHYIPLKKDFSNLEEVIQIVKEDALREEITKRAYEEIVCSGRWGYSLLAQQMGKLMHGNGRGAMLPFPKEFSRRERWLWRWIPLEAAVWRGVKAVAPQRALRGIRKLKASLGGESN